MIALFNFIFKSRFGVVLIWNGELFQRASVSILNSLGRNPASISMNIDYCAEIKFFMIRLNALVDTNA